jgi:outer membrane biogenesis lipoprotein LolB
METIYLAGFAIVFLCFVLRGKSEEPKTDTTPPTNQLAAPTQYQAQSINHLEGVGTMAIRATNDAHFGKFETLDGSTFNWSIERK